MRLHYIYIFKRIVGEIRQWAGYVIFTGHTTSVGKIILSGHQMKRTTWKSEKNVGE
jgi:hypothetical protein